MTGQKIVHTLIADTAKAIAEEVWEVCSSNDRFHKAYPHVSTFVHGKWSEFIGDARESLAQLLAKPMDPKVAAVMKPPIYEALLIDGESKAPAPQRRRTLSATDNPRGARIDQNTTARGPAQSRRSAPV